MQCPDCGYVMTAFDKECPRCEKMEARVKPCLKCGTASPAAAVFCERCRHRFGDPLEKPRSAPAAPPREQAAPSFNLGIPFAPAPGAASSSGPPAPAPAASPQAGQIGSASVLPPDYLCCRVCGNAGVQKVSAICQSGSWSGRATGQSLGVGYGSDGPVPVSSVTTSSVSGQTTLAQMLMPPSRPSFAQDGCLPTLGAVMGLVGLLAAVGCMFGGAEIGAVVAWLIVFGGGVAIYLSVSSQAWAQRRRVAEQTPHWEQAMAAWNRLFYCPRCAHVFDPAAGAFAPAHQMRQLL
jgi:hypothetical protein